MSRTVPFHKRLSGLGGHSQSVKKSVGVQTDAVIPDTMGRLPPPPPTSSTRTRVPASSDRAIPTATDGSSDCKPASRVSSSAGTTKQTDSSIVSEDPGEGTLSLSISQFSTLSDTMCSPSQRIRGVTWRIMVMPKQHVVQKKQQKCMGFFLQCSPDKTYSDAWSCKADAEMRLLSKKQGISHFVRKTSHVYTSKENDWGYSCFMTWADVLDESQGYIKSDEVTLEIVVRADYPRNMMSRDEFVQHIDRWFKLAEHQKTRGEIDLALEANSQALKFCKDKDEETKIRLDNQREMLVKQKLLDSINRIENNKDQRSSETLKPTSLRQALTGIQKNVAVRGGQKNVKKAERKTIQQIKKKRNDSTKEARRRDDETEEENEQRASTSPAIPCSPCPTELAFRCDKPDCDCLHNFSENYAGIVDDTQSASTDYSQSEHESFSGSEASEDAAEASQYFQEAIDLSILEDLGSVQCYDDEDEEEEEEDEEGLIKEQTENSCQTEESGPGEYAAPLSTPMPMIRRERRPAGNCDRSFSIDAADFPAELQEQFRQVYEGSLTALAKKIDLDQNPLLNFCYEHFSLNGPVEIGAEDYQDLLTACAAEEQTELANLDEQTRYEAINDDHVTCCLLTGLCVVHGRKLLRPLDNLHEALKEYKKHQEDKLLPAAASDRKAVAQPTGRKIVSAARRKLTPSRSELVSATVSEAQEEEATTGAGIESPDYSDEEEHFPSEAECERSIRKLLGDFDLCKIDEVVTAKLASMRLAGYTNESMYQLLQQLYNYYQALSQTGDQLDQLIRSILEAGLISIADLKSKKDSEALALEVDRLKKMVASYQEARRKMEFTYGESERKHKTTCDDLNSQITQLNNQLKDSRNQIKKIERKLKQEETKVATLQGECLDMEDAKKTFKKDLDRLKKSLTDDRTKARKEKDKDAETIRRLEVEVAEKEAEREREKKLAEERLRDSKSRENKLEKEKKNLAQASASHLERARTAEIQCLELALQSALYRFDQTKENFEAGYKEVTENVKKARTQSDIEAVRRNVAEWDAFKEQIETAIRNMRSDYESAIEAVSKGSKTWNQLSDLKPPTPPELPRVLRLPPVQVVPPSTAVVHPPITVPPAGVIGQPRTPQSSHRHRSSNGVRAAETIPSTSSTAFPSPPSSPSKTPKIVNDDLAPAASPWSWMTPLGNIQDVIRPSVNDPRPYEMWSNTYQMPNAPSVEQRPGNWTGPEWRDNSSTRQYRPPGMPSFFES